MRLKEFIEIMENYTPMDCTFPFTYKEMKFFVQLLNDYAEYLNQYDDSASMRSMTSTCRIYVTTLTENYNITHIESIYSGLYSEYNEISRTNNIKTFKDFITPYLRDIKLNELLK